MIANAEGELKTNKLPREIKIAPIMAHSGFYTFIKSLTQVPAITNSPPILHPILVPNLSKIQLQGALTKGCAIAPNKEHKVTISAE